MNQLVSQISPQFLERIARSAADLPEAFRERNATRAAHGARLRQAIAAVIREEPGIVARDVRSKLDAASIGSIPRLRAIQLHMRAIRHSA